MNLDTVVSVITQITGGLGLTWPLGGDLVPVVMRKLAKKEKGVDPVVMITVSGSVVQGNMSPLAFGLRREVYVVDITTVVPNGNDQSSNISVYALWRSLIERRFSKPPLYGVSECFDLNILQGSFLDRDNIKAGNDVQLVRVEVTCVTNY